jgi:putative Mg2+ transporter-C (MgtC) family protein
MLTYPQFLERTTCAFLCGLVVGFERQWRQRSAGLRTYSLVSVGASLFVTVSCFFLTQDSSVTRIASYVISGIGFLGAGVVMKTGGGIRGINTAATIWCSAAVGTLSGFGFFAEAVTGILFINTLLRPLVSLVNRQPVDPTEQEVRYCLNMTCKGRNESHFRGLFIQLLGISPLTLQELESVKANDSQHVVIRAILLAGERIDPQVEQITSRLSMEPGIVGISWQLLPA